MNVDLDLEEKLYWDNYEKAERESLANAPLLNEPEDERVYTVRCKSPCCSAVLLAYNSVEELVCDTDCLRDYQQSLEN